MSLRRSRNASERGMGAVFTGRDEKGTCDCRFDACWGAEVAIDVSKDQKEEDELLTFARRGESGDGTLGKNLCG